MLICSLFLLGMACSNEKIVTPEAPKKTEFQKPQTPEQFQVTTEDALTRAEKILSQHQTRSTPRVVKSCEYYVAKPATRSMADTVEVAFHLINYEDNAGFVMVAADERATDVYAYSDEGQLNPEDFEDNPGLNLYMDMAVDHYSAEVQGLIAPPDNPFPEDPITPVTPIAPPDVIRLPLEMYNGELHHCKTEVTEYAGECIIAARWHQNSPYNIFTAPYIAGCSIIAATQIMSYHEHPNSFNGYTFNWEAIKEQASYSTEDCLGAIQISRLNWLVGSLGSANYRYENGKYATGMSAENTKYVFNNMGYTCSDVSGYSNSLIAQNVLDGKPVWVAGYNSEKSSGHAWVIDGCRYTVTNYTYYKTYAPYNVAGGKMVSGPYYFHHNWGWKDYDKNSGYFLSSDLDTHQGMLYHMEVIYHITPSEYILIPTL